MLTLRKRRDAERLYEAGRALFETGQYAQALEELTKAEEAFRRLDVPGHPFSHVLGNGVSGLANTLALKARCFELLGDCAGAIVSYETCLINAPFERKRPFRRFWNEIRLRMTACYEDKARINDQEHIAALLHDPPVHIDTTLVFPYSLGPDRSALARLYELDPEQYHRFRDFYLRAKKRDEQARRLNRATGLASMRNIGIGVWSILSVLWIVYGVITLRLLFLKK